MLSGRAKGKRYQDDLAELLGVDPGWLHGDDTRPPEWCLPAIEAYEGWVLRLRGAWREWFGDTAGDGTDASASRSLGHPVVGGETRWQATALSDPDRRAIGKRLGMAAHDERLEHLIQGSWELVPFEDLERLAATLRVAEPTHPDHVRRGHEQAGEVRKQQDWITGRLMQRMRRYWLPPELFQVSRLALVALRQQRDYQGKDVTDVDDALELLWRQQLQQQERRGEVPESFVEETGRETWTRLSELQARYGAEDVDPDDRYRSRLPSGKTDAENAKGTETGLDAED